MLKTNHREVNEDSEGYRSTQTVYISTERKLTCQIFELEQSQECTNTMLTPKLQLLVTRITLALD